MRWFEFSRGTIEQEMQYGAVWNQISQRLTASDVLTRLKQQRPETETDKYIRIHCKSQTGCNLEPEMNAEDLEGRCIWKNVQ